MSVSFAMAEGRNLHFKIYAMNQLQALAKAFAGSDRDGGQVARAVNEGYCRNQRPSPTDPKVLFVINARVDLGPDGKPLYTVLFALNVKYYELVTRPAPNDSYTIDRFTPLTFAAFMAAARHYDRQTASEFGREDAQIKAAYDPSPSPSSNAAAMPSGGITPVGKMDEYMDTAGALKKEGEYAQTNQFVRL